MNGNQQAFRAVILFGILVAIHWQCSKLRDGGPALPDGKEPAALKEGPIPGIDGDGAAPAVGGGKGASKAGAYDRLPDARLVVREGNDGDSFQVRAGGREFELRLYFVDTPESYLSDRYADQRRRVAEQARELGGIAVEEAVEVGRRAKAYVREQLEGRPFTVYTYWEPVYDSGRYYGFVELPDGSDLGTRLVEQGLGRVHTKGPGSKERPVPTPQGETFFQARDRLEAAAREARQAKRGAWAY